jgi:hypothetical protein
MKINKKELDSWTKDGSLFDTDKTPLQYQLAEQLLDNMSDELKIELLTRCITKDATSKKEEGRDSQETIYWHIKRNLQGYKP